MKNTLHFLLAAVFTLSALSAGAAPEKTGESGRPYLEFRLAEYAEGTVWIDHVELSEVKKPEKK